MAITIGKRRGLQQCSSRQGTFTCLALDHRQNLRRSFNPENPAQVPDSELTHFKLNVIKQIAEEATAVLLDPQYSAPQAVAAGVIPKETGLVVALEATGYTGDPTARESRILPGWSVKKAKMMGASMVKLLVYYHPDAKTAAEIERFVKHVAGECRKFDLALMLEPLSYSLDPQESKLSSDEKRYVVSSTAKKLTSFGVDLLKSEFPLDRENMDRHEWESACGELSDASQAPWILLSAAVDYEIFLSQVETACEAGASGIAVGRAVWKEAVGLSLNDQNDFLGNTAKKRLAELTQLCNSAGRPWYSEIQLDQTISPDWYAQYHR